jgi:Tol biopolymer transport system component
MRRAQLLLVVLATLPVYGCLHSPMCWSPDGQWLAYTVVVRPRSETLSPGWTFERVAPIATKAAGSATDPWAREGQIEGISYRLWATRPETGESVLLDECTGPITSPGWSPDGSALAFGRLVPESGGRARFEIVVQSAPTQQKVLRSQPLVRLAGEADVENLPAVAVAWSPDGRFLAVPQVEPRGLEILRADDGRLLKSIDEAYMPAWSPDGSKLAYCRRGETEGLYCIDLKFGSPRRLAEILKATQAPVWSRDGESVVVARRRPQSGRGDPSSEHGELVRVRVDNSRIEALRLPSEDPGEAGKKFRGVSFSFDRDGEELFCSVLVDGQKPHIIWYRLQNGSIYKRFNPFDLLMPVGALAVSPVDRKLALRVGPLDVGALPAVYDLETRKLTPIVPDDDARLEWLATTISTVRELLRSTVPPPLIGKEVIERPTLLPAPGEIPVEQETLLRLHRLASIGLGLCDRPTDAPADLALAEILDEARFFFDYLKQDYDAALTSLEAMEARTTSVDRRGQILYLRAQTLLGQGDIKWAPELISYLQSIQARPPQLFEMTPVGPALTTDRSSADRWADFLALRAETLKHIRPADADGLDLLENVIPGAPEPAFGLGPAAPPFPNLRGEIPILRLPNQRLDMNAVIPFLPQQQEPPQPQARPVIPLLPRAQRPNAPGPR